MELFLQILPSIKTSSPDPNDDFEQARVLVFKNLKATILILKRYRNLITSVCVEERQSLGDL